MVQDYDGATVVDATGEEVGTVEQSTLMTPAGCAWYV